MQVAYAAIAAAILTSACGGGTTTPKAQDPAAAAKAESSSKASTVQVDRTTPDKALKSYWAMKDAIQLDEQLFSREIIPKYRELRKPLTALMSNELVKSFDSPATEGPDTFGRDIIEVKVESDSRAVILVSIKNTTPIPAGAVNRPGI